MEEEKVDLLLDVYFLEMRVLQIQAAVAVQVRVLPQVLQTLVQEDQVL